MNVRIMRGYLSRSIERHNIDMMYIFTRQTGIVQIWLQTIIYPQSRICRDIIAHSIRNPVTHGSGITCASHRYIVVFCCISAHASLDCIIHFVMHLVCDFHVPCLMEINDLYFLKQQDTNTNFERGDPLSYYLATELIFYARTSALSSLVSYLHF